MAILRGARPQLDNVIGFNELPNQNLGVCLTNLLTG